MDDLDIAEFHGREAAKFSLAGLDAARARAHALLLVLLGGGAGMGSLGLAQVAQSHLLAVAALAAALWWFALAGWVVVRALRSAPVSPWAVPGVPGKFANWQVWAVEQGASGAPKPDPMRAMRAHFCDVADESAQGYRQASGRAYAALDWAYLGMSLTPLVAGCAAVWAWGWPVAC